VEWVETTGGSIDEAKDAALDQLGVDEHDAEFEILDEPRAGLFGRTRGEARVRARIRPVAPRAKAERRDRRRRKGGSEGKDAGGGGRSRGTAGDVVEPAAEPSSAENQPAAEDTERVGDAGAGGATGGRRGRSRAVSRRGSDEEPSTKPPTEQQGAKTMTTELSLEQQGDLVEDFLDGLLDAFDLDGDLRRVEIDDDTIEVHIDGEDLGLLIGPKGQTLTAVQELSRTVVQRRSEGPTRGRIRLDVAGYREKRREALERFTRQVAEEVRASGSRKALEPMAPPDRKVVHDTVNTIDGVGTVSEGEEPRRRVVIVPED
jgi:spoIIIJ-associated protein